MGGRSGGNELLNEEGMTPRPLSHDLCISALGRIFDGRVATKRPPVLVSLRVSLPVRLAVCVRLRASTLGALLMMLPL